MRHPKILGDILADDHRAHRLCLCGFAQADQAPEPPARRFGSREPPDFRPKPGVFVGQLVVVALHVDQINIATEEARSSPGKGRNEVLDRSRHAKQRTIYRIEILRIPNARAQKEERHCEQQNDEDDIPIAPKPIHAGRTIVGIWAFFALSSGHASLDPSWLMSSMRRPRR